MGKLKESANKVCKKAKNLAKEVWSYRYDATDAVICFLAGVGLASILLDVTGLTDYSYDLAERRGRAKGYQNGFNDGMNTASRVIGVANNGGKPVEYSDTKV